MGLPILCLLAGVVLGRLGTGPDPAALDNLIEFCLGAVVFLASMDVGAKRTVLYALKNRGLKILLVPLGTAFGSVLGGALMGAVFSMRLGDAAAVSAGFGYYSLSSGLLTGLGGAALGSLAFLCNILRELMALLLIPFLAKIHPCCAVSVGGAAAMDTTLGMVSRCTDEETTVISMFSGIVLSILVPILVPLLHSL